MSLEDISRVIQGLVTGIGFLGAGTILKGSSVENVKGLTTAAGIWLTAAIGVAVGLGHEATAVLSTLLALAIFVLMPRLGVTRRCAQHASGARPIARPDRTIVHPRVIPCCAIHGSSRCFSPRRLPLAAAAKPPSCRWKAVMARPCPARAEQDAAAHGSYRPGQRLATRRQAAGRAQSARRGIRHGPGPSTLAVCASQWGCTGGRKRRPPKQENQGLRGWIAKKLMARAGSGGPSANRITLLRDGDGDGVPEVRTTFLENLNSPFGMALIGDSFYGQHRCPAALPLRTGC